MCDFCAYWLCDDGYLCRKCAPPDAHADPQKLLRELLAVIHGDGGHYARRHGLAKATADALGHYYALVEENAKLRHRAATEQTDSATTGSAEMLDSNDARPPEPTIDDYRCLAMVKEGLGARLRWQKLKAIVANGVDGPGYTDIRRGFKEVLAVMIELEGGPVVYTFKSNPDGEDEYIVPGEENSR